MGTRSKTRKKTTSKSVTFSSVPAGDRYLDLVRECPLRIIRSESEYGQAIAMLDRLSDLGNDRTVDETEYLLSLTVIVKKYEDEHHFMPLVSGVDMLRYLLETHNVTQSSRGPWQQDLQFPRFPRSLRASGSSGSSTSPSWLNFLASSKPFSWTIDRERLGREIPHLKMPV